MAEEYGSVPPKAKTKIEYRFYVGYDSDSSFSAAISGTSIYILEEFCDMFLSKGFWVTPITEVGNGD